MLVDQRSVGPECDAPSETLLLLLFLTSSQIKSPSCLRHWVSVKLRYIRHEVLRLHTDITAAVCLEPLAACSQTINAQHADDEMPCSWAKHLPRQQPRFFNLLVQLPDNLREDVITADIWQHVEKQQHAHWACQQTKQLLVQQTQPAVCLVTSQQLWTLIYQQMNVKRRAATKLLLLIKKHHHKCEISAWEEKKDGSCLSSVASPLTLTTFYHTNSLFSCSFSVSLSDCRLTPPGVTDSYFLSGRTSWSAAVLAVCSGACWDTGDVMRRSSRLFDTSLVFLGR